MSSEDGVGPDPGPPPESPASGDPGAEGPDARTAAAAALTRARQAARDRGLRPGSPPTRRVRPAAPATFSGAGSGGRDGRDPQRLGDQLERLLLDRGWNDDVAVGAVVGRWPAIVGPAVADHVTPVGFEGSVLTVQADSTAWATQMRLLTSSVLGRIEAEAGEGVVTEIVVRGPAAPSWRRGPRRTPGPGPRDTYG